MTEPVKPKSNTIPKRVREVMTLEQLYETGLTTPSIEKLVLAKEDFSKPCASYCSSFCKLSCNSRDLESVDFRTPARELRSGVDVLFVLPSHRPNEKTKYGKSKMGWSEDNLHLKVLQHLVDKHLSEFKVSHRFLLKCRPSQSEKITSTALKRCSPYLTSEITRLKPKVIVCLGKESAQGLSLKNPTRGFFKDLEVGGAVIPTLITIHPRITTMIRQNSSGSFWGTDYLEILERDLKKVSMLLKGEVALRDIDTVIDEFCRERLFITTSIAEVVQLKHEILSLPPRSILAWDSETTSLDPWAPHARTLMYQFTYKRPSDGKVISVVVPLWHRANTLYDANEAFIHLEEILLDENTQKIGHNLSFDILFSKVVHGLHPKSVAFDTMLLIHSLNSGIQGFYDLKVSTNDLLFKLQLGGYEDKLDLAALKRAATLAIKRRMAKGTAGEIDEQEGALSLDSEVSIEVGEVTVF